MPIHRHSYAARVTIPMGVSKISILTLSYDTGWNPRSRKQLRKVIIEHTVARQSCRRTIDQPIGVN